jgi:hypothetical protein
MSHAEQLKAFKELSRKFKGKNGITSQSEKDVDPVVPKINKSNVASKARVHTSIGTGKQGVKKNPNEPGKKRGVKPGSTRTVHNTKYNQCVKNGLSEKIYEDHIAGRTHEQLSEDYNISKYMVGKLIKDERAKALEESE